MNCDRRAAAGDGRLEKEAAGAAGRRTPERDEEEHETEIHFRVTAI